MSHFKKPQEALNLLLNAGALLNIPLHATVYVFKQFADMLVRIANKLGLQKIYM
jgi:hypothetical protein